MYDKTKTNLIDRREMLRVKLKTLAAEARIIRKEEKRTSGQLRQELHQHRVFDVRRASRETHIAYGLIKGRTFAQIENKHKEGTKDPNWDSIEKMLKKYGPPGWKLNTIAPVSYEPLVVTARPSAEAVAA